MPDDTPPTNPAPEPTTTAPAEHDLNILQQAIEALRADVDALRQSIGGHTHDGYSPNEHEHKGYSTSEHNHETAPPVTSSENDKPDTTPKREHLWARKLW